MVESGDGTSLLKPQSNYLDNNFLITNKKVLIVTYYWPPAGGAGVQRILKFAKYLSEFGWTPIILTIANGDYPWIDKSLNNDITSNITVYKTPGFSLHNLHKIFNRRKNTIAPYAFTESGESNFREKLSIWIKFNIVPDSRIGWYFPAISEAKKILKKEKIDLVFSTSPPQTAHFVAKKISKKLKIPLVTDFRDPWTDVFWLQNSKRLKIVNRIDRILEKKVMKNASAVTTVSPGLAKIFRAKTHNPVHIITNGFDEPYFAKKSYKRSNKFRITYTGSLSKEQTLQPFCEVVNLAIQNGKIEKNRLRIQLFGNFPGFVSNLMNEMNLGKNIEMQPFMAAGHVIEHIFQSELLLLIIPDTKQNEGILTSKIFDYIGSKRPILCFGPPESDAAKLLNETKSGEIFDYKQIDEAADFLESIYRAWVSRESENQVYGDKHLSKYTRRTKSQELCKVFDSLLMS